MVKPVIIELFSASTCHRCSKAKKKVQKLVEDFADDRMVYREVDVVDELDYAVSLGILITPTIAINGQLVFAGMPSLKRLEDEIRTRLASLT